MSNLLDKASVILTPTAYNNGEALCVKPSDGSGDFDFSRNSAATRVNAQGLVENVQILSSNLVQNGDFSEEGVQEVSNGSFSQEGVQLITNGDFTNNIDGWLNYISVSTWDNGTIKTTCTLNAAWIRQNNVVTANKYYKVTFKAKASNISQNIKIYNGTFTDTGLSFDEVDVYQEFTYYLYTTVTDIIIGQQTVSVGDTINFDNVSVREVGQDWNLGTGWSIGEDKAVADGSSGNLNLTQDCLELGKTYTITYTILDYLQGSLRIKMGGWTSGSLRTSNGTYTEILSNSNPSANTSIYFQGINNFNGSVTNISVKEVGMDWELVGDFEVNNQEAYITNASQYSQLTNQIGVNYLLSGKKYKLTADIETLSISGALAYRYSGGAIQRIYTTDIIDGKFTAYFTMPQDGNFWFQTTANYTGLNATITNISVIEITDDTNLPRINYENFSYQDDLGSEEVVNGSFDDGSTGWNVVGVSPTFINSTAVFQNDAKIYQANAAAAGKKNKVVINLNEISGDGIRVYYGGGFTKVYSVQDIIDNDLKIEETIEFVGGETLYIYSLTSSTYAVIDNVSVKEYLGQEVVPNSGCGSWLFEPQSTNLYINSEPTTNEAGQSGISYETYSINRFTNCIKYGDNSVDRYRYGGNTTAGVINTHSYFVLMDDGSEPNVGNSASDDFSILINGAYASTILPSVNYGNGLWRVSGSKQSFVSNSNNGIYKFSTQSAKGFRVFGLQAEALPYATSYIPTNGEPNGVTRNQDVCTNGGSLATINSTEGTLYFEGKTTYDNTTSRRISLSDGSTSNRVSLEFDELIENKLKVFITRNGASEVLEYTAPNLSIYNKIAIKWKANDFAIWFNGSEVVIVTIEPRVPVGLTELSFDGGNNANNFFGKTKAVAVWKEALSDQELADLTYPTPTDPTFSLDFDTIAEQFTFARGSEATYVDAQGLIQSTNELGEELITNGDFATDTNWAKQAGWTISGGTANANMILGGNGNIFQSALVSGKTYELTFTVSNYVQGNIRNVSQASNLWTEYNSNGTFTEIFVANNANLFMNANASESTQLSIDNVSVKEVISATNTPRLDYSTGAEAFLLEPQSTNLIPYSSDFSNSYYAKSSVTLTSGFLAPDGSNNAYKVAGIIGTSYLGNLTANTHLRSIYVRTVSGTGQIKLIGSVDVFDVTEQWTRVSYNPQASTYQFAVDFRGGTNISEVLIWGMQVEALSYPTSYIPTNGSQTTRNQETCINATPEINSEEGVLYAEISALANDGTLRMIVLNDGTQSNRVGLQYSSTNNLITAAYDIGGAGQASLNYTLTDAQSFNKIAFKYRQNDFSLYVNGIEVATDVSGNVLPANTLNNLEFEYGDNRFFFFGNTKDIQVYTKALSDAELINLTTI